MRCGEDCRSKTRVSETREMRGGSVIRRRRECPTCGHRFTTYEMRSLAIMVSEREYVPFKSDAADIAAEIMAELPTADEIADEVMNRVEVPTVEDIADGVIEALLAEAEARNGPPALEAGPMALLAEFVEVGENEDEDEY